MSTWRQVLEVYESQLRAMRLGRPDVHALGAPRGEEKLGEQNYKPLGRHPRLRGAEERGEHVRESPGGQREGLGC